jgi:hypothetical protein
MQAPVEIHYAGVVVARAEEMREVEGGDLFIVTKEPLPVGTLVGVSTPEAQFNVRVAHVVETVDGADNGMRVRRLGDGDPGANLWVPPPPAKAAPVPEPVEEKAPAVEPAPAVIESPAASTPEAQVTLPWPAPVEAQTTPAEPAPVEAPVVTPQPAAAEAEAPAATAAPAPEPAAEAAPAEEVADNGSTASIETTAERRAEQMPLIDDLPPARPTQGGNARRRTKRRK